MLSKSSEKRSECRGNTGAYHSVEFSLKGLDLCHQFRIWDKDSDALNVLIKGDSRVLPLLNVGDILEMKYYSTGSIYPSENIRTAIRHVTKKNQGRLRGHYLVGLEILENMRS